MKAYDIVGYTRDGATYCTLHGEEDWDPIFAGDDNVQEQVCDTCLHEWITSRVDTEVPGWVYLLGERPEESDE